MEQYNTLVSCFLPILTLNDDSAQLTLQLSLSLSAQNPKMYSIIFFLSSLFPKLWIFILMLFPGYCYQDLNKETKQYPYTRIYVYMFFLHFFLCFISMASVFTFQYRSDSFVSLGSNH